MQVESRTDALMVPLAELGRGDIARVGGKNASLGEMIGKLEQAGIRVPGGFATTAEAYCKFLEHNELTERVRARLGELAKEAYRARREGAARGVQALVGKWLGAKARKMVGHRLVNTRRKEREAYVLGDDEVLELARRARAIEAHYGQPMDMEWAKTPDSFIAVKRAVARAESA